MECPLVTSFVARVGVVLAASLIFFVFTVKRIECGKDPRNVKEFAILFFNLGCQQMSGGVLLAIFSVLHDKINEPGHTPLIWYSVNFDFETLFTLTYLCMFKKIASIMFFGWASKLAQRDIRVGEVVDDKRNVIWSAVAANFVFSVGIIGVAARLASMGSIVLVSFLPLSPVSLMADVYSCITSCAALTAVTLYVKPLVIDFLVFFVSDKVFKANARASTMV